MAAVEVLQEQHPRPRLICASGLRWHGCWATTTPARGPRIKPISPAGGQWCEEHDLEPLGVTRAHVDAYARELQAAGRSRATIARRLAALSSFYRYAVS
jgi:hypothetical protein